MKLPRKRLISALFKNYIRMYAARDARLIEHFSENFSGYTGGGDFIVGNASEWADITRLDFAQVPTRIRIEMLDLLLRDLSDSVVLATALFHIHLPTPEPILSREAVRLSLVFVQEDGDWKVAHSGISVPYFLVGKGEVYPIKGLYGQNQELALLLKESKRALAEATRQLDALKQVSHQVRAYLETCLESDPDIETVADVLGYSRRTLTRRLGEEGSSFLQIKDCLRRALALQLLATGRWSVEAISARVGFADLTTFHRAFRKWTGTTPLGYQRSSA
ncbi:nuclear transport factor 2 family protein [Rhodocyclus tenuis]|nr:nuclear transport factor 2 family protein [Rhodocyclus tenuis]